MFLATTQTIRNCARYSRFFSASAETKDAYKLPELDYGYGALEPHISGEIMEIHHSKHHNTYVTNLNKTEGALKEAQASNDVEQQIALQSAMKFNGGGHINHSIFWKCLAPPKQGGGEKPDPNSPLAKALQSQFGDIDSFVSTFNTKTAAVQGSGWGWLAYNPTTKVVEIATTQNQDPLEPTTGLVPLLGIDVWEHAYYLQYRNVRPDYLNAIWNVVNWQEVQSRFDDATN
mmetsp:Transcript_1769/g.2491  ORF Transcript_1769/g.2491 Transcript_1769/m.2491 type:complete len:231 (+) Transcript_1769:15-707(+)